MTTESIEIAKWIEDETLQRTTDDFKLYGCVIGHCIPPKFESYCKIFHPFEVTNEEEDILEPNKEYGQQVSLNILNDSQALRKPPTFFSCKTLSVILQTINIQYKLTKK